VDPLAPILALGKRQRRAGAILAIAGTLCVHGAPAAEAASSLLDLRQFANQVLDTVRDRLRSELDVDVDRLPPPPPPPAPEPEPAPTHEPEPVKPANEPPPPPSPAQAGKILAQEPDPNEPVDLTGEGFVTGNSDRFAGGITAAEGKSTQAVRQASATPTGVPGGTGTAPAPPPPREDKSRSPVPDLSSTNWKDCGFPAEADIEGVNEAVVTLIVTVSPEGRAKAVTVVRESPAGVGFGKLARQCAFRKPFVPGLDSNGNPITKTTVPIPVRFTR
jgi:periplasmic protein TonB